MGICKRAWKEISSDEVLTALGEGIHVLLVDLAIQKVYDCYTLMFENIWNRLDDEDCKFFIEEDQKDE